MAKGKTTKDSFPLFDSNSYRESFLKNLNYYSIEVDDKDKKDWAIEYWKSQGKKIVGLGKLADYHFHTVGALAHMIYFRELQLDVRDISFCEMRYAVLISIVNKEMSKEPQPSSPQTCKSEDIIYKIIRAEFDHGIDMFFSGEEFDAKNYLIRNAVKPVVAKQIADSFKSILKEVKDAIDEKDAQLVEGYSHLGKRRLNKFYEYLKQLQSSCDVASAITKASNKSKPSKIKSPIELTKKVQYKKDDSVLSLKSEHPSKMIYTSEVWIYNTKIRRLFRYVALQGHKLSVNGTTIINFDCEKSCGKIIRKPDVQLKDVQTFTSRPMNKLFNDIKGTATKATGRLNEDCIIIKCFN